MKLASRDKVERQIDRMSKLPAVPHILVRLNKMVEDSHSSAQDLGNVILKDQALTLRILKLVNSAYYRNSNQEKVSLVTMARTGHSGECQSRGSRRPSQSSSSTSAAMRESSSRMASPRSGVAREGSPA